MRPSRNAVRQFTAFVCQSSPRSGHLLQEHEATQRRAAGQGDATTLWPASPLRSIGRADDSVAVAEPLVQCPKQPSNRG